MWRGERVTRSHTGLTGGPECFTHTWCEYYSVVQGSSSRNTCSRRVCLCLEKTARYQLVVAYFCTVLAEQCSACLLALYLYCASESGHGSRGRCMLHCLYYAHACACPALRVLWYQITHIKLDMSGITLFIGYAYHVIFVLTDLNVVWSCLRGPFS